MGELVTGWATEFPVSVSKNSLPRATQERRACLGSRFGGFSVSGKRGQNNSLCPSSCRCCSVRLFWVNLTLSRITLTDTQGGGGGRFNLLGCSQLNQVDKIKHNMQLPAVEVSPEKLEGDPPFVSPSPWIFSHF